MFLPYKHASDVPSTPTSSHVIDDNSTTIHNHVDNSINITLNKLVQNFEIYIAGDPSQLAIQSRQHWQEGVGLPVAYRHPRGCQKALP